jgi:AraC-like DNA-binding protein
LVNRYPELLEGLYTDYKSGKCSCLKTGNLINTSEMQHVIDQVDTAFAKEKPDSLYIEAKILELLSLQIQSCNCAEPGAIKLKTTDRKKICEAEYLLTKDLSQSITISQLARKIGLNNKKLKQGFKEVFGNTIHTHLLKHKMQRACHLLLKSELNIAEVGLECGYENASHFSTAFKQKFGVTPMGFRKGKLEQAF